MKIRTAAFDTPPFYFRMLPRPRRELRHYQIPQLDIVAHSMGGLVSKGMMYQADEPLRKRLRVFISMASPFGGHTAAAAGLKWSPVIAPVWWAMAPGSSYLQKIDSVDLTQGPNHHLIYSYSHEVGGEREEDDGVVTNPCTLALVPAILQGGASRVMNPEC